MIRKVLYATLSLTLVLSSFVFSLATSASAAELMDTPFQNGPYRPTGLSGMVHYTIPFGARTKKGATPYLGLSLEATKSFRGNDGLNDRYSLTGTLADLRFTTKGFRSAHLGGATMLDSAGLSKGDVFKPSTLLWVIVVGAVGAGAYLIIDKKSQPATTTPSF